MDRHFPAVVVALLCLIVVANSRAVGTVQAQPVKGIFFEPFGSLTTFDDFSGPLTDRWTIYRGNPQIISVPGVGPVLAFDHPQPDNCGFFKDPSSSALYLSKLTSCCESTTSFADGMIEFDICFATPVESGASAILTFRMQSDDTYYALRLTNTKDWRCYFAKWMGCNWYPLGTQSACGVFQTGVWSHVIVTIGGPWFQAYKDGVQICKAADDTWQRGSWGGTGIGFQNNYYGGVFAIDNFRIPNGFDWTIYRGSPGRDPASGRSAASMFYDHPSELGDAAPFADVNAYSAYISKPDTRCFTSGVIEFDILFDNPGGQKAYFTFKMKSDTQYYALRLSSTKDFECYFLKQKGWGWDNFDILGVKSGPGIVPFQTWTHIRVVIDGSRLEAYMESPGDCGTFSSILLCSAWVTEVDPCAPCASCSQPVSGAWGGIGFYSAYNRGLFHIDNVKLHITQ